MIDYFSILDEKLNIIHHNGRKIKLQIRYSTSKDSVGRKFFCDIYDSHWRVLSSNSAVSFEDAVHKIIDKINLDWANNHGFSFEGELM